MPEFLKPVLVPIHSAGWPFIAIFAVVTLAVGWLWTPFLVIGGILTAWCTYFFRDPVRHTPTREGLIISPADGVVQMITDAVPPSELEMPIEALTRVSIFMNVFDVHVNRSPCAAIIERMEHRTGQGRRRGPFLPAMKKESEHNERVRTVFLCEDELRIEVCQISGALARTIVPWTAVGDQLRRGQRYGMIRLGSRVDIRAPAELFSPVVESAESGNPKLPKGQFVQAGSSILFKKKQVIS